MNRNVTVNRKTEGGRVKRPSNWWIHMIMVFAALCCVIPFVLVIVISFTSERSILKNGYGFVPEEWSLAAYKYVFVNPETVLKAYGITIFTTVVGTLVGLFIGSMFAYVISRKDYPYKKILTFYIFFTMLFNGGLVPTYVMYVNSLHIRNTLWALLIPNMLLGGWNLLMMRTYFGANIPDSLIESAYLDGAGEFTIYLRIVLPLSKPVLSAIGFMSALGYWNSWFNSMVYITDQDLYSLSYLMTKTLMDIQSLKAAIELPLEMRAAIGQMPSETVRMAMAVIGVGPMFAVFPFFQKYFVKGLTVGAVKG